jgi:hypothetical protein
MLVSSRSRMPRKGLKNLPTLPLSVFTPPNTGTSDQFPLSVSPSTVHPEIVIDAHVTTNDGDLGQWKKEIGQSLGGRIGGVILTLQGKDLDVEKTLAEYAQLFLIELLAEDMRRLDSGNETVVMAVAVPFSLESASPPALPKSKYPISLSTTYTNPVPDSPGFKWALDQGCPIDLAIRCNAMENDAQWESLEDMLTKAIQDSPKKTPVVLCQLRPFSVLIGS